MEVTIFTRAKALPILKNDRLLALARRWFPTLTLSDDYLWFKLLAAEADLQRQLRCFFQPWQILPIFATQDEVNQYLNADPPVPVYQEPGYDYTPDIFSGPRWGLVEVRQTPMISVQSISFTYPDPWETLYTFPNDWIRPDLKYGVINLMPSQTAVQGISLNAYILSAFSGGLTVPLTLQVRYTAGLKNVWQDYSDLVDLIFKATALSILEDQYIPSSGSISVDGLSQTLSFEGQKYQDLIDARAKTLRRSIHGQRMVAM